ncbi:aldehyde dehydrogenase [Sinobaca sp. H24]|uniref:aldehyde dehydrogenase family protein n=1 Tax=Sinobaca sp. H24 TaxID=2923376 RepID=UPI00207AD9F1|nr:aldehyde dehydrogenase family protein [Sinobaca sp. H24]
MKSIYINESWQEGNGPVRSIVNPASEDAIASIKDADALQVDKAASAALECFEHSSWRFDASARKQVLLQAASILLKRKDEAAALETRNTGKPIREAELDIEDTAACLQYYAGLLPDFLTETREMEDGTTSLVTKEAIGACGLIIPWNFPLLLGIWKVAPALAAGNTIVYKPSELTPLTAVLLVEILEEAGLPAGVFQLVTGDGTVGKAIVDHPALTKISFTGSVSTGRSIYASCAESMKRVSLELGGKSPLLVFDDVSVEKAVSWAVFAAFFNQGEVCVAAPRFLVQETILDSFQEKLVEQLLQLKAGDPLLPDTELGPVISRRHYEQVSTAVAQAEDAGAQRLCGGRKLDGPGFYLDPVILTGVTQSMDIVQEEIFGPVATIQSFADPEEAVALANGTPYGLAAGILTENKQLADWVQARLQAGIIWINSYHTPYVNAPWGGVKASGIGRELGPEGLTSYTEYKHTNYSSSLSSPGWYHFEK